LPVWRDSVSANSVARWSRIAESLWSAADTFTRVVAACSHDTPGAERPSAACTAFLKGSERAQQQWELERRFHAFEAGL